MTEWSIYDTNQKCGDNAYASFHLESEEVINDNT